MKSCSLLICSLVLGLVTVHAQDNPKIGFLSPATAQSEIDRAKVADIRRLLELTGATALAKQAMDSMEKSIKPLLTNSFPPGEYREKLIDLFFERFHSKVSSEQLLDLAIPVYDKYLTHEEIKDLIKFYETPLGQKTLSVLPQLVSEMQQNGKKWGGDLGKQSMQEVLTEHPDLAKALENATKKDHPE